MTSFAFCLMNFSFTAEADSLKLLTEKNHCSDFDRNMNVWVLARSDFCAENYRHCFTGTREGLHCGCLHRPDVSLMVQQYKGKAFYEVSCSHTSPPWYLENKKGSQRLLVGAHKKKVHKLPKAMPNHTIFHFGKFLTCQNVAQIFVELLLVGMQQEH